MSATPKPAMPPMIGVTSQLMPAPLEMCRGCGKALNCLRACGGALAETRTCRLEAGEDLERASLAAYRYFAGALWQQYGEEAWIHQ